MQVHLNVPTISISMAGLQWVKIGYYGSPSDPKSAWYRESLKWFGIQFAELEALDDASIGNLDVVLLCGRFELADIASKTLRRWTDQGGVLIVSGSDFGLASFLGVKPSSGWQSVGYTKNQESGSHWPDDVPLAKFFGAHLHEAADAKVFATLGEGHVALAHMEHGQGATWFWAPHLGTSISTMVMGRGVSTDGIGPSDGTAFLDDGVLRAEDGITLDFEKDRFRTNDCKTPFFAFPHADILREVWIRCVLGACEQTGKAFQIIWPWPNCAEATSMISFDCDISQRDEVRRLSGMLDVYGMKPTWLVNSPGFSPETYRSIRGGNGEPGVLFSAEDWEAERLRVEQLAVQRSSGFENVLASRANNGQWQGYAEFYGMLAQSSARVSLSKGGRQSGTSGFAFGTCVPFQPLTQSGEVIGAFELPYVGTIPAFPDAAAETLMVSAWKRHGCFHLAASADVVHNEEHEASLRRIATLMKQNHMPSITSSEFLSIQVARAGLRMQTRRADAVTEFSLTSPVRAHGFSYLFGGIAEANFTFDGKKLHGLPMKRLGQNWVGIHFTIDAKTPMPLTMSAELAKAA